MSIEKLELKHIQAYPLDTLEFILSEKGIFNLDSEHGTPHQATQPMKITNLLIGERIEVELHSEKSNWGVGFVELYEIKPALRPLSDLTKYPELINLLFNWYFKEDNMLKIDLSSYYNKEKEYTWINYKYTVEYDNYSDKVNGGSRFNHDIIPSLPNLIHQELLSNHFDVFGLIDENLAIDLNTI